MKYFLLLAGLVAALPQISHATANATNRKSDDIAIFFSNDIHGETEPCG